MVRYCVASNCKELYDKDSIIKLHKFPVDSDRRNKWIQAMKVDNFVPKKLASLCSKHFEEKCFLIVNNRRMLRRDAIPSIFNDLPSAVPSSSGVPSISSLREILNKKMYCLTDTCFLCIKNNIKVQNVLIEDTDGIVVNEKLRCFFPDIIDSTPDAHKLVCLECLEKLRISYDFKQSVIRNNIAFKDYIEKLQCEHKSHQQLALSQHPTNLPFTRDCASIEVENGDENIHDQSCQLTTNENDTFFTKFGDQTEDINLKTENIEIVDHLIEEIYIKQEPIVDHDLNTNYLDENSNESEDNNFECQICHLGFSSPKYLENHTSRCNKNIHKPESIGDETVSNHNNKSCTTTSDSEYNDQLKQEGTKKRLYKCSECHKEFTRSSNLERHRRIHSGEKPYQCQTCHKKFTQVVDLDRHKLTHTGEKPHQCNVCNKTFSRKNNLIIHKRSHDNIRPYQCSVCSKAFTESGTLTTHMRIHTGETPYQCHICQFKCAHASHLKYHIRTHTGEKPYQCEHCKKLFTSSSHLNVHLRRLHTEHN